MENGDAPGLSAILRHLGRLAPGRLERTRRLDTQAGPVHGSGRLITLDDDLALGVGDPEAALLLETDRHAAEKGERVTEDALGPLVVVVVEVRVLRGTLGL